MTKYPKVLVENYIKGASNDAVKALNESLKLNGYKGKGLDLSKIILENLELKKLI